MCEVCLNASGVLVLRYVLCLNAIHLDFNTEHFLSDIRFAT